MKPGNLHCKVLNPAVMPIDEEEKCARNYRRALLVIIFEICTKSW